MYKSPGSNCDGVMMYELSPDWWSLSSAQVDPAQSSGGISGHQVLVSLHVTSDQLILMYVLLSEVTRNISTPNVLQTIKKRNRKVM